MKNKFLYTAILLIAGCYSPSSDPEIMNLFGNTNECTNDSASYTGNCYSNSDALEYCNQYIFGGPYAVICPEYVLPDDEKCHSYAFFPDFLPEQTFLCCRSTSPQNP